MIGPGEPARVNLSADEEDRDDLGSGHLSDASRAAAIAAALPYVATYFARTDRLELRSSPAIDVRPVAALGRQLAEADPLLAALRLRIVLATGQQLTDTVRQILRTATFRYDLVQDEHVGHLHGRLDVVRYIRERGRRSAPRRYPVIDTERSTSTPENALAVFAVRWLRYEIDAALDVLPVGPEAREVSDGLGLRSELVRFEAHPTLRGAARVADDVHHRETVGDLLDLVEARIAAGRVPRPAAYEELVEWTRSALSGEPSGDAGNSRGAFYGPQFDPKLFELWCLDQLLSAMRRLLGEPRTTTNDLLRQARSEPLAIWSAGADEVALYFQPQLADVVAAPNRWRYEPGSARLRGTPDLAATCRHVNGSRDVVLIDAKLRRRFARSQEVYKLLGYFENAGDVVHRGALVFHQPEDNDSTARQTLRREPETSGHVEIIAVDPGKPEGAANAFDIVAELIVSATGVRADEAAAATAAGSYDSDATEEERTGARAQALAVAQLSAMSAALPAEVLDATAAHLRAVLENTWDEVGADAQRMLVSAVHFGVTAPDGADLSGPVLGLCAPLERLLKNRIAVPALASLNHLPGCDPTRWTFGTLLARLEDATGTPGGRSARELKRYLSLKDIETAELAAVLPALDRVRSQHRNKAAHQGLIDRPQWDEVFRLIVRADAALLRRLVEVLPQAP